MDKLPTASIINTDGKRTVLALAHTPYGLDWHATEDGSLHEVGLGGYRSVSEAVDALITCYSDPMWGLRVQNLDVHDVYHVLDPSELPVGDLMITLRPLDMEHPGVDDLSTEASDPESVWMSCAEYARGRGWKDWDGEVYVITGDDSSRRWLRVTSDGWSL